MTKRAKASPVMHIPAMARPKKPWSKNFEAAGVRVRVYEREAGSLLYREVRLDDGTKDRKSLGHRDRGLAGDQATELARSIYELRSAGQLSALTIGELFTLYEAHRVPSLSAKRQEIVRRTYLGYFRRHFARELVLEDLTQTHVDAYVVARRAGAIKSPKHRGVKTTPRDGTLRAELNWFRSVVRWALGYKVNGRRILRSNPFDGLALVREKNVRRPVASEDRYKRTLVVADTIDRRGRLTCMLALARYTGRRVNAICQLRASDVALSRDAVLRMLAGSGQDERLADHMPHGAIRWAAASDKQGFEELTAISKPARAAIERYQRAHSRVAGAWLFPNAKKPDAPISKHAADNLLRRAELAAKLPKLDRGMWHAYRRLWASERKHLPDVDTAKAGGWRDVVTMRQAYQRSDPATVLRVIELAPDPAEADSDAAAER
jgi:integrase